ncbi:carbohydrate ABC transporter permease [Pseudonocardia kunmingensis]|uniref:Carbohydrate ABC transporter membrane protein 2 (CUT1 family) n=1 Tax=Pseudonocardia kunmingensis TaxID=630975 RepID=A0A543D0J0_9PSEU|nr:carbohydrate ABC transporter permease [Pseudonocardia kunmingensis]TQM02856.1 carbohydrate ABC transporter membrane protein 2 (CUT1 family) [Pseudonocardia kunmingensis]
MSTATADRRRAGVPWGTVFPTLVLLGAAGYFLLPVVWVAFSATKSTGELFTTPSFAFGGSLVDNVVELFRYEDGRFSLWLANSFLYSVAGAALSTLFSAGAGYALAVYRFPGKRVIMVGLVGGVLLPGITLTIPQYMLFAQLGITNTYWAVLIPASITPFGIYLAYVFGRASVPQEMVEAARVDGSGEWRTFRSIGLPLLVPGLVTIFLLQFIGAWNNFLLPYIMLDEPDLFPITVAMYLMLNRGGSEPVLYSLAVAGSAVAIVPVIAFVLILQRFWRLDLVSGSIK